MTQVVAHWIFAVTSVIIYKLSICLIFAKIKTNRQLGKYITLLRDDACVAPDKATVIMYKASIILMVTEKNQSNTTFNKNREIVIPLFFCNELQLNCDKQQSRLLQFTAVRFANNVKYIVIESS